MVNKCKSYHLQPTLRYTYHPLTGQPTAHDIEVGVCWGTKECDQCDCGGDRTQCDFYPEVREKALKEREPKFGEWISVEDGLPDEKVNCLVHYKHVYCNNDGYWAIGVSFYDSHEFRIGLAYKVTHWMPLPAPPTEKEN